MHAYSNYVNICNIIIYWVDSLYPTRIKYIARSVYVFGNEDLNYMQIKLRYFLLQNILVCF